MFTRTLTILVVAALTAACSGRIEAPSTTAGGGATGTAAPAPGQQAPPTAAPGKPPAVKPPAVQPPPRPALALAPGEAPAIPATRRQLLDVVVAAEKAIRDPKVRGRALASAAHHQQVAYRELAGRPRWQPWVISRMPRRLRAAARANLDANLQLSGLGTPQSELPKWRIVRPPPPEELAGYYRRAERRYGVPWAYLAAIHLVETRMGRIRGTSVAGAQGPMQFMPQTWAAWGRGDVNDPGDAIDAAARYLVDHGAPGNMPRALWHYNHSDRYVAAITDYAKTMLAEPATYRGYYHWQVYYRTTRGTAWLPVGWKG